MDDLARRTLKQRRQRRSYFRLRESQLAVALTAARLWESRAMLHYSRKSLVKRRAG